MENSNEQPDQRLTSGALAEKCAEFIHRSETLEASLILAKEEVSRLECVRLKGGVVDGSVYRTDKAF